MVYTSTRVLITWWDPSSNKIKMSSSCKFNEIEYKDPNGNTTPGSELQMINKYEEKNSYLRPARKRIR